MRFIFVRHGKTHFNEIQLKQGWCDSPLTKQGIKEIENIAKADKVVGIGEIGLDYYWNKENKELQQMAFINQIKLANKLNLPIIIHTREAVMDTLQILKENTVNKKGIFPRHFYVFLLLLYLYLRQIFRHQDVHVNQIISYQILFLSS